MFQIGYGQSPKGLERFRERAALNISSEFLSAGCALADILSIVGVTSAVYVAYHLVMFDDDPQAIAGVQIGMVLSGLYSGFQYLKGRYRLQSYLRGAKQLRSLLVSWVSAFFVVAWLAFLLKITDQFSRGALTIVFFSGMATVAGTRFMVARFLRNAIADQRIVSRRAYLVFLNDSVPDQAAIRELTDHGVQVVGASNAKEIEEIADGSESFEEHCEKILSSITSAFQTKEFDEIYLFSRWGDWRTLQHVGAALDKLPLSVYLMADTHVQELVQAKSVEVGPFVGFEFQRAPLSTGEQALKRGLDIFLAALGLILLSPLLIAVSITILLESGRPIIFKQERKGFGGRPFTIYKFRTMTVCEDGDTIVQASRQDKRVTRLGKVLRRSSIDELPQLFNVLLGSMSIVGPRPHAIAHDTEYDRLVARYAYRHHMRPGLTGWAQVNGYRGETPQVRMMEERVRHDLWYISHWSIWIDIWIIMRTFVSLLFDKNAY